MPKNSSPPDTARFFDRDMAAAYDQRNSGLRPISDCLHFLTDLVLTDLPDDARLLCVGVGTGAEILSLAQNHPGWFFVGVDPSVEMLEVARKRIEEAGLANRCELVAGYVEDVAEQGFHAVTAMLVAHFIPLADRPTFYGAIHKRLRPDGRFVSAEISCDLNAPGFAAMLQDWGRVQTLMGATEASLAALPDMLRNVLSVVSPGRTADLWNDTGFTPPVEFFQAFMIHGWHAQRRTTRS